MLELSPRIRVAIRTYADTDDDVDDLLQECWVHILERLDRYEPRGSFAGWAVAVSRNVCKMRLRAKKRAGLAGISFRNEYRIHTEFRKKNTGRTGIGATVLGAIRPRCAGPAS